MIFKSCTVKGCGQPALTDSEYCYKHLPDKLLFLKHIKEYLIKNTSFKKLVLDGLELSNLTLRGKTFLECSFSHVKLSCIDFTGTAMWFVFLDFSDLDNCIFTDTELKCSVFAGSEINNCDFSSSEILRCNFTGVHCIETVFNDSDLYSTRFINSSIENTSFNDCNLKKVHFEKGRLKIVDMKYSNIEEAHF